MGAQSLHNKQIMDSIVKAIKADPKPPTILLSDLDFLEIEVLDSQQFIDDDLRGTLQSVSRAWLNSNLQKRGLNNGAIDEQRSQAKWSSNQFD